MSQVLDSERFVIRFLNKWVMSDEVLFITYEKIQKNKTMLHIKCSNKIIIISYLKNAWIQSSSVVDFNHIFSAYLVNMEYK